MLHLYDRAMMARVPSLTLDPQLKILLIDRIARLASPAGDLTDHTEFLVIEAGDNEEDIIRHIGFSPLVEPIDGQRYPHRDFQPCWDWLAEHQGWFELLVTFGSTFAYTLFIRDADGVLPELRLMCREYV